MDRTLTSKPSVCFEVEKIIGISSDGEFQVQWAPSWVSGFHLVGCEHLIHEFLQQQAVRDKRLSDAHAFAEVRSPSNDLAVQDCEHVNGNAEVNVTDKVGVDEITNLAVNLTQYTDGADSANQKCVVDSAPMEAGVYVTGLFDWNDANESNDRKPAISLTRNTDVTEQESEMDLTGKMDIGLDGRLCAMESRIENTLKVETDGNPFDSSELLPNFMDDNCQGIVTECQKSKSGAVDVRREEGDEETYQSEHESLCDNGTESVPYLTQHPEIMSSGNLMASAGNGRPMLDSGNLSSTESVNIDSHIRMNTFVLNVRKLNIHSENISVQDESSDTADFTEKKQRHTCSTCDKEFSYKGSLKKHKKLHHQNRKHLKLHHQNRRYLCEECDISYTRKLHLTRHLMSKHSSLRPFTCEVKKCKKRFTRKDNCQRHIRRHLNRISVRRASYLCNESERNSPNSKENRESNASRFANKRKNHNCPICGEQFALRSLLRQHFRRHSEYRPYVCEYCATSFYDSVSLNTHRYDSLNDT